MAIIVLIRMEYRLYCASILVQKITVMNLEIHLYSTFLMSTAFGNGLIEQLGFPVADTKKVTRGPRFKIDSEPRLISRWCLMFKKNSIFSLESKKLNGYVLHTDSVSRGRFVEETNFELYLTHDGETSDSPVVEGKYFSGRGSSTSRGLRYTTITR